MNKKIITGLIFLMGLSILGILIIQLVWMNNAIRVRNELFDRNINEALTNTTSKLENFRFINRMSQRDTAFDSNFFSQGPPPSSRNRNSGRITIPANPRDSAGRQILKFINESRNGRRPGFGRNENRNSNRFGDQNEHVVVVNADSLGHRLDSIYSHRINRLDSMAENSRFLQDADSAVRRRFEVRSNQLKRVKDRFVTELYNWESKDPSIEQINQVLQPELKYRKIPIKFEIGVIGDSLISEKTEKADSALLFNSPYKVRLNPNNFFQTGKLIAIYFPEKDTFIYKTLNWLLLISLIFSVIVLATFAVSVHFILKQKKISEMKSDFINNMTHEFKTPIATISVASDSILNSKIIEDPIKIRYFIEMIKKENIRMNRQVEDILTIARLDKKDFEFKWEAFNLHDVISDAIQSISIQIEKKGGTIKTELQATNPVATSDATHFANVIYNLLDNANKYSSGVPEIKISTHNNNKGVIISVEDKGIGMTKVVQNRIFERFYRQTTGNIHNVKGFGLGLSYVNAVIEANRGTITVHSEPGKGSRFDVFIPFVKG